MESCVQHPEVESVVHCERCVDPLCGTCIRFDGGRKICEKCLVLGEKEARAAGIRRALVRLSVVAMMGLLIAGVARYEVRYDYGSRGSKIAAFEESLSKNPCDGEAMTGLAQTMVDAGNEEDALPKSLDFLGRCPEVPKLRYLVYDLYQQTGHTDEAIEQVNKLLESNPYDPDYWTWRGLRRQDQRHWDESAADLTQAILLRPDGPGVPMQLAISLQEAKRACEGIGPLRELLRRHPDLPEATDVAKRIAMLTGDPSCSAWKTSGSADLHFTPGDVGIRGEGMLNGNVKASFVVDTELLYVGIGPELAKAAQLVAPAGQSWIVTTDQGQQSLPWMLVNSISVGGATAGKVPVVLLKEPLRGADGVVGRAFLSRFHVEGRYDEVRITAE